MRDSVVGFNNAVPHVQQPAIHLPHFQRSFAQMLDPEEGNELKFVPSANINGIRCATIEKSDVLDEITYWQNAVLCSVMGANPPFEVMKGFFNRIWGNFAIDRIIYVRKGVFLVRFSHQEDKIQVEKRGFYFFDSKPMLVKGWNPNMDLHSESIRSLPLWIQLPSLDIKYWGIESLSKIGSILGVPIKTDKITKERQAIRYARLLVEMPIEGPFPDHVDFFNEDGVLIRQQISYEWIPNKCTHCAMLGHTEDVCKKRKEVVRTEWRKKAQTTLSPPRVTSRPGPNPAPMPRPLEASTSLEPPPEVFTLVTKGTSPKRSPEPPEPPLRESHNSFEVLNEEHILDVLQDVLHRENQSIDPLHVKHR
mgnify:CR=1 FL=1